MVRAFLLDDQIHHADEPRCPHCAEGYPRPCPCGGLIHAVGVPLDEELPEVATTRCDQCGRSEEESFGARIAS